jgi:hypothetical protein
VSSALEIAHLGIPVEEDENPVGRGAFINPPEGYREEGKRCCGGVRSPTWKYWRQKGD